MIPSSRISGLQAEVLALYRSVLRAARKKDPSKSEGTWELARTTFRKDAKSVKRNDFQKIEFLIRQGRKKIRYLNMPGLVKATSLAPADSRQDGRVSSG